MTAFLSTTLVFPISPGSPTAGPRRECFDVTITDDSLVENTESFSLLLQEDTFSSNTGAKISPNLTEIFILDEDGKLAMCPYFSCYVQHSLNTCYLEQHKLVSFIVEEIVRILCSSSSS